MVSKLLIFKNIISNIFYQIVNIIVNFLLTPLILASFGSDINGLIQTIRQILNYTSLVGTGISEATVVSLYKPIAEKDNSKINSILNSCNNAFFISGCIFSFLALCVSFVYPIIVDTKIDYYNSIILIIVLSISGASEFFAIGKYRSLLIADQRIYILNIIQATSLIVGLIIAYFLIKNDFDIIFVQLGISISFILRGLLIGIYIRKRYLFLNKKIPRDNNSLSNRKSATIHQLAGVISFGSQITIISIFCGNKDASIYSVYLLIFSGLGMLLSTISSSLIGTFGNIIAVNDKKLLNRSFRIYEGIFYTIGFSTYITAFILIIPFLYLYLNSIPDINDYIRPSTAILFSLLGLVNSLRTPAATLINASGHYKQTQNGAIIEMIICLLGQFILVKEFGIDGVVFASLIAYAYRFIDIDIYINIKILNKSKLINAVRVCMYFILSAILIYIMNSYSILINDYLTFFLYGIVIFIILFLIISILGILFYFIYKDW